MRCQVTELTASEVSGYRIYSKQGVRLQNLQQTSCQVTELTANEVSGYRTYSKQGVRLQNLKQPRCQDSIS